MSQTTQQPVEDFIQALNINGLNGRMLHMPAPKGKSREILFVYGHHSTLERWWGLVQAMNKYGTVTMPDLPGFGGMDSLNKIGEKPTIDALADYLASFIKMRYKRKKVTIVGMSFGFVVATRMLQRCPELVKKVDMLVSVVGFAHHDDFTFSKSRMALYKFSSLFFSYRLPSIFFRNVLLHPWILRAGYAKTSNASKKFANTSKEDFNEQMNFEIHLWHANDARTHLYTTYQFLTVDNCQKQIKAPLWHVSVSADRYFDNNIVEQHLRVIFEDVTIVKAKLDSHAPSVIASVEMAEPLLPSKLRRALARA